MTTKLVALLRGVNVAGRTLGMADLRRLFVDLGHTDVATYLQSGNVIFTPAAGPRSRLSAAIEQRIAAELDLTVTVLVRSGKDLAQVVAGNPFTSRSADPATLHVTFLADRPGADRVKHLEAPSGVPDELSLAGREVYLHCPNGYGRTKLNNSFFERRLGVAATTRNWRTVTTLHELAAA
jgi:uncharacterized protein (DUF1697 family)